MRGLSPALAERSFTQPRDLAVSSVGAMTKQWPSYSSSPCFSKYAAPTWNWISAAGRPGRVRTKATDSATVEDSGPERRRSHSARFLGASALYSEWVSDISQIIVRNG